MVLRWRLALAFLGFVRRFCRFLGLLFALYLVGICLVGRFVKYINSRILDYFLGFVTASSSAMFHL
jgi:hypothetical protein